MVKCKNCGDTIVIFSDNHGAVHILDKPHRGFVKYHRCGARYNTMLSPYMCEKLELFEGVNW